MAVTFAKAQKRKCKLKLAVAGPAGSGKTYSALAIATGLGGRIAVIDTERGSAAKYGDRFAFDVTELADRSIDGYIGALTAAAEAGYDVVAIDSVLERLGAGNLLVALEGASHQVGQFGFSHGRSPWLAGREKFVVQVNRNLVADQGVEAVDHATGRIQVAPFVGVSDGLEVLGVSPVQVGQARVRCRLRLRGPATDGQVEAREAVLLRSGRRLVCLSVHRSLLRCDTFSRCFFELGRELLLYSQIICSPHDLEEWRLMSEGMEASENPREDSAPTPGNIGPSDGGQVNPMAMTVAQAARVLSAVGVGRISEDMLNRHIAAGAPTTPDGRINLVFYAAWLNQRDKEAYGS